MVQWLGLCTFTTKGPSSIPGQGTQIPQVPQHGQKRERERERERERKPQNKTKKKKEILQLKNALTEMKISLDSFNSIFDQAEEISKDIGNLTPAPIE